MPRKYSPSGVTRAQTYSLGDHAFSGMVVQQEPQLLAPTQTELLYNLFPYRAGSLRRRPGITFSSLTPLKRVYAAGHLYGSNIYAASTTTSDTIRLYLENGTEILHETLSSPANKITLTARGATSTAQGIQFVNFGNFLYGVDGVRAMFRVYKKSGTYYWEDVASFSAPDAPTASLNVNAVGATGSWSQPTLAIAGGTSMLAATDGTTYYDLQSYSDTEALGTTPTASGSDTKPWYTSNASNETKVAIDGDGTRFLELDNDPDFGVEDAQILSFRDVATTTTLYYPSPTAPAVEKKRIYTVNFYYTSDTSGGEWKPQTIQVTLHLTNGGSSIGSVVKTFTFDTAGELGYFSEIFDLRSVSGTFDGVKLVIAQATPAGDNKRAGIRVYAATLNVSHIGFSLDKRQEGTRWTFSRGSQLSTTDGTVLLGGERIQFTLSGSEDWSSYDNLFLDMVWAQWVQGTFRVYAKVGNYIIYLNDPVLTTSGYNVGTTGVKSSLTAVTAWGIEFIGDVTTVVNDEVPYNYTLFTLSGLAGGGSFPAGRTYVYRFVEADLVDDLTKPDSADDYRAESPGSPYSNAVTTLDSTYSIGVTLPASLTNSAATLYKIYRNGGIYEDGYDRLVAMVFVATSESVGDSGGKWAWNATTKVFTDLTADTDLLNAEIMEPGRDGPPSAPTLIAVHQNRIVVAQENSVYISWLPGSADERPYFTLINDLSDPNIEIKGFTANIAGKATSSPSNDGPLQALVSYGTALFLFRTGEIHFLGGWNPTNFTVQPFIQARGLGCSRYNAAAVVEDHLWVATNKQVYRIAGESYEPVGLPLRGIDYTDPIILKWYRMVLIRVGANAIYNYYANYLPIRPPTEKFPHGNSPSNYEWLAYDYDNNSWSIISFPFAIETGFNLNSAQYDQDLYLFPYDGTLAYKGGITATWWQNKGQDVLGATNHPVKWTLVTRGYGVSDAAGTSYYQTNRPFQINVGIGMENAGTAGYKVFNWRITGPRGYTTSGQVSLAEDAGTTNLERFRFTGVRGIGDVRDVWHQAVLWGTADQDLQIHSVQIQTSESGIARA